MVEYKDLEFTLPLVHEEHNYNGNNSHRAPY